MPTTNEAKDHLCTVRMTADEEQRANAVARHYGINLSSTIRMLIKREARDLGLEPASTKARTKATK